MQTKAEGFWLSPQQSLVWLLQGESTAYRSQGALLVEGELDANLLQLAVGNTVARHEILRTTFHRPAGLKVPFQVVADGSKEFAWQQLYLSHLNVTEQEARIEELFVSEGRRPFDLEQESPLRLLLLQLSAQRHVLLMNLPALCADAQTLWNLTAEVSRLYAAAGAPAESWDEPFQYVDFSEGQAELLAGEAGRAGMWYWSNQDFSSLKTLALPFEGKPSREPVFTPGSYTSVLAPELIDRIEAVAHQHETTAALMLSACWQSLLWRLIQRPEMIIGNLYDGRDYDEFTNALGAFAKWLPIRAFFNDESRFDEILKQVSEASREAKGWHEFFVREGQSETRRIAVGPQFLPFGYEYEEWPTKLSAGAISWSLLKQSSCFEPFKVKLVCSRSAGSLRLNFHYHTALLTNEAVQCIARQFGALLESALDDPGARVCELEMNTAAERRQLIEGFNQTGRDYAQDLCLHELFERQAGRAPEATAVVCEDQALSYQDLNVRANQLAHYLQKAGVGPEVTVALCLERSVEMMVAILGTLKAGGAYVPLDPAYPKARLSLMLNDAAPALLLTQRQLLEKLPEHPPRTLCLDADWAKIELESDANLPRSAAPENLVYVIYTSGSTGHPKGVGIEHRQLVNYVNAIVERLDLPSPANYATVSTFSADLGHTMVFPALCLGSCLHIISHERASDPSALAAYFTRHRIDCLKVVPSHIEALLTWPNAGELMPRRRLVLGGEASRWEMIGRLQNLIPGCSIYNHYGPTETTVGVITHRFDQSAEPDGTLMVPLGRPIPNGEIYLLDVAQNPVPVGVVGELHVGGAGLARGYLNQPDLTAGRFIPHPFSRQPGARLYQTGDLARYRPDGVIEFCGRIDNQVKFNGYRIELNEIRSALNQHPQISDCVLALPVDKNGNAVIVAYYVSRQELEVGELRAMLQESIIEETIPNVFVHLKRLPLTLNGKINYDALPSLEEIRQTTRQSYVAPRTPTETALAGICATVLGLERVSIHDNFFEMGGHSLLAIRLITQLRDDFNVEIPLGTFFEKPTVADLALVITRIQIEQEDAAEMTVLIEELKDLSGDEVRQVLSHELQLIEDRLSE